jgi:hypothetical protein
MARAVTPAAVVLMVVALAAGPARADDAPAPSTAASIDERIARGKRLFDDQDYAAAVQLLTPITRDARATRSQRLAALEQIALAEFIRRDLAAARGTFERILDIDPGYDVRATRGGDQVFDVAVLARRRGELEYATTVATPRGGWRWRARLVPPAARKGYVLEYYVEARGAGGEAIGRIGSPDAPLDLAVGAGEGDRPWYGRWYVIAGAAVVTGIAGAVIVGATRGPSDGTLGTITVTE